MIERTITFTDFAIQAGFQPGPDGKYNLPDEQATADKLAKAAEVLLGEWQPGDERISVMITGAAPVWAWLAIAHSLHGRCACLQYSAPNCKPKDIWRHGC